jgi:hypothetical protein
MADPERSPKRTFTQMAALVLALALAPWAHPLTFRAMPGWVTGASGNTDSAYVGHRTRAVVPFESTAWIAKIVRYRNEPTADPPNTTLAHLPANGLIVWAVIYNPANSGAPLRLDLRKARHLKCCGGAYVAGGNYELTGYGPKRAYSAIVRIYFGSHPTKRLLARAQRALNHLQLPAPR